MKCEPMQLMMPNGKNAIEFCKDRDMEFIIITEDELKV